MPDFQSWASYLYFQSSTLNEYRYIHDSDTQKFLDAVLVTSNERRKTISKDTLLWRAQIGYSEPKTKGEQPAPFPPERMKPIPNKAVEGRANPKGIPYLYLANDMNTAMAEVRPWKDSLISVGQFRTKKELTVVDFSEKSEKHDGFIFYLKEPSPEKRESRVWSDINLAFQRPVNPADNTADYVPTQIIAELFKNNGDDGIIYSSSLGKGLNVMLFDIDVANIISCFLYRVDNISFKFKEDANPYFIKP